MHCEVPLVVVEVAACVRAHHLPLGPMTARISPLLAVPVTSLSTLLFFMSTHTSVKLRVGLSLPSLIATICAGRVGGGVTPVGVDDSILPARVDRLTSPLVCRFSPSFVMDWNGAGSGDIYTLAAPPFALQRLHHHLRSCDNTRLQGWGVNIFSTMGIPQ